MCPWMDLKVHHVCGAKLLVLLQKISRCSWIFGENGAKLHLKRVFVWPEKRILVWYLFQVSLIISGPGGWYKYKVVLINDALINVHPGNKVALLIALFLVTQSWLIIIQVKVLLNDGYVWANEGYCLASAMKQLK
jgi:hypothetical protein